MKKYHVNKITGRVAVCRAVKRCPFGDLTDDHYPSYEEAASVYESMMGENILPRPMVYDQLKEMDANDLAHGFLNMAQDVGLDADELSDALEFASLLHAGQMRRNRGRHDTTPYIEHPLRVSYRLLRLGVRDPNIIKAALLHDTVEDCAQLFAKNVLGREDEIEENEARKLLADFIANRYGSKVKDIVLSVTNEHRPKEVAATMTQKEKNLVYKLHLQAEVVDNEPALLTKFSDFMDNAGGLHHNDIPGNERIIKRMAGKYQPCVEVFVIEFKKELSSIDETARHKCIANLKRVEDRLNGLLEKYANL